MGKSKAGERYSISIGIMDAGNADTTSMMVFNDAAIREFVMNIPINHIPYGTAKIVGDSGNTGNPSSGTYGKLVINGLYGLNDIFELPIYVISAVRQEISQDAATIDISFMLGSENLHRVMEGFAFDGTSVEAMAKLFSTAEVDATDYVTPAKAANGVSDNMTWRFVEGSLSDHLDGVVTHASIPGDVLYWSYDDRHLTFRIGTFNVAKTGSEKHFFMYTGDSVMDTTSATRKVKGSETNLWFYNGYVPSDLAGSTREYRSPNLMIDSTVVGNSKDTGVCSGECWRAILGTMGASDAYMEKSTYGQQHVVKPFPSNTHKTYAIAPFVRDYMLAEYSKMVKVRLYNHPGPAVGECVHFYAASAKLRSGDFLPDPNYTGRYIIVGKRIVKDATVATGILGKSRSANTSDLVTEITMISNNGYGGTSSADYKAVMSVADSVTESLKKEGK